jgi:predicted nucleic acid-binding protein
MIKSVYLDTSVFGGYFDEEFSDNTVPFFERIGDERIQIFVSRLLIAELAGAPDEVRELLNQIPREQQIFVELTEEARELANKYIDENVVGRTSRADCQHIAMATLAKADVLVSWNFKHIVNLDRIRGYNGINLLMGYSPIEIRTPKEIERYD